MTKTGFVTMGSSHVCFPRGVLGCLLATDLCLDFVDWDNCVSDIRIRFSGGETEVELWDGERDLRRLGVAEEFLVNAVGFEVTDLRR